MKRLVCCLAVLSLAACSQKRPDAPIAPSLPPPAAAPAPATQGSPPPVDWSRLPSLGPAPKWAPPAVDTWKLPNGLAVWYLKQDHVPLANVTLLIPRGAATDPTGKAGLTALTADMLDEGAAGLDALAIGDAFQRLGTDYEASAGTDAVTVSVNLLADQAEPTLELLAKILFKPDFPAAEFERRKAQRVASLLASEADPATTRSIVLRRMLFGDGYGAFPADGLRTTVQSLKLADVKKHYAAIMAPTGAALVIVGALDKAAVEGLVSKHFGGWQAPAGATLATPAPLAVEPPERRIFFVDHPGATQSAIAVATRARGADAPEYYEALYYNWVLGGAFMSRVNLNLREDKGYTYGARSGFTRWKSAGFFSVGALVKAQNTKESVEEVFKELAAAGGARPVTPVELTEARGGLLLSFPGRFEHMGAVAGQITELPLYGREPDWYTRWPSRVEAVTPDAVAALAAKHAPAEPYLVVISGDRKTVEPTLAALNLPITVCDALGNRLTP